METTVINEQQIRSLRAETKGTAEKIHFNNAGASMPPDVVVDTIITYLKEEAAGGGYEVESRHHDQLENTYALIAKLINADTNEVAIVENASVGWGIAFNGIRFEQGDVVITSEMEYATNLIGFLNAQNNYGIEIKIIGNDENGNFSLPALQQAISPKTKLIAITHIASTAGVMTPIVEIGKIARKHHIIYLVDACQSAGQVPLDVKQIGCDMLAVTGRKYLRAPRGTGFLYVKKEIQDNLRSFFMDGFSAPTLSETGFKTRDDARRFELYEKNRGLQLGLGKAIEYALNIGIERIWQRVHYLAAQLRLQLSAVEGITVHDSGEQRCGIVTFSLKGIDATRVKILLEERDINVSVAKAISALIYMNRQGLARTVRASLHYYNTEEEIKKMCDELKAILASDN